MTIRTHYLAAAAAIGAIAIPAAAQSSYQYQSYPVQQMPQPYPGQPGYGQPGYAQNPVQQIVDSLLGSRYNVSDRQAVSQCASAAMTQAAAQYGNNNYGQRYGYNGYNGYNGYSNPMRVTSITDVQRRNNSLRVFGTMSSGERFSGPYANRAYAAGDVTFRCNVDYRGSVTNVRIGRSIAYSR